MKSKAFPIAVIVIFALVALVGLWQYTLYQKLSKTDMSCGGDWSYMSKCPLGSSCRSLGQGPLAGGVCQPWLSSFFGIFKVQKEQVPAPSPTPTPTPTPAVEDEVTGRRAYSKTEYGFSIKYPPSWVIGGENIPKLYTKERGVVSSSERRSGV